MPRTHRPSYSQWRVNIDAGLAALITNELLDPVYAKATYGARSALVNELLQTWAREKGLYDRAPNRQPLTLTEPR